MDESRRYRILDVIGEGGFGKVYRARLEGAEGFAKDVAIKLLTDAEAPEDVLKRFRDESRILGLVRDRAIVTVDPPTRLDGRWAVVMEFVDGANCERMLKIKALPPKVSVEVVQEVARALHNVYHQIGPDGEPLKLIHRDIKPANIQVTPSGSVKVLDFGIARADFDNRESRTTTHIGGTMGYIAPERLHGEEGPEGDVYSLGVTLIAMFCGRRPKPKNREKMLKWVSQNEELQAVWDLAELMMAPEPADRPTAREVEDRCIQLAGELSGLPLRRWAEAEVRELALAVEDDLVGSVLTETMAYLPRFSEGTILREDTQSSPPSRRWLALAAIAVLSMMLGVAGLAGGAVYLMVEPGRTQVVTAPVVQTVTVPEPAVVVAPEPVVEELPEETDAVVELPPEPAPAAPIAAPVRPVPKPRPPPKETKKLKRLPVTFGSVPFGATVYVDGRKIGTTPLGSKELTEGSHRVKMVRGDARIEKRIKVGKREPIKYIWKGDEWLTFF